MDDRKFLGQFKCTHTHTHKQTKEKGMTGTSVNIVQFNIASVM